MTPVTDERPPQLAESLRDALRIAPGEGGGAAIQESLDRQHPADVAAALRDLAMSEALAVFLWLDTPTAAEVLDELDSDLTRYLIRHIPPARFAALLDRMPPDEAAEIVAEAGQAERVRLLTDLAEHAPGDAADIRSLLAYPERTAGRIMTTRFPAFRREITASQILAGLHLTAYDLEAVSNVFAVDAELRLEGVASIREVIAASPRATLESFMRSDIISVGPETSQGEVARMVARYNLSSIPVVDTDRRLLGIVTVDDAVDVLAEEMEQDYFQMVGSDADEMDRRTPFQVARLRLPWLLGTMAIELGAGLVIHQFDEVLTRVILLASFMPVISAISGNVGLQSAAIVVRGLDTGHVSLSHWGRSVTRELSSALILALTCGVILGTVGGLWSGHAPFGIIIGIALVTSMLTAGFMGSVIPMLSKRLGFDPATTAGPFETAFQDVIGFGVFLWLASLLEHWLI